MNSIKNFFKRFFYGVIVVIGRIIAAPFVAITGVFLYLLSTALLATSKEDAEASFESIRKRRLMKKEIRHQQALQKARHKEELERLSKEAIKNLYPGLYR
jgi:hypothetical protein